MQKLPRRKWRGKKDSANIGYQYPPLWGQHSYTNGAGIFRISLFARYVKSNMPFGSGYEHPQLSDEEAWDVAAFVNSQPRPSKDISKDWPKIESKPMDHPFGPYADTFPNTSINTALFCQSLITKNSISLNNLDNCNRSVRMSHQRLKMNPSNYL